MRRRVTYRPSKSQSIFGALVGGIFVLIGVTGAIPHLGAFGVLWTLVAVGITGMDLYQAFGETYSGPEIHIEDEADRREGPADLNARSRLEQLEGLREAGLIDEQEYREKRREILEEL